MLQIVVNRLDSQKEPASLSDTVNVFVLHYLIFTPMLIRSFTIYFLPLPHERLIVPLIIQLFQGCFVVLFSSILDRSLAA